MITSLSLTRTVQQAILIGDDITVYVDEVRGNSVRLTIKAPREVKILRDELVDWEDESEEE